jgi:hypothetical protein
VSNYLTEKQLSEKIHRSIHTLRRDRWEGKGIPYIRLGRQILYESSAIERYLTDHTVKTEETPG